MFGGNGLNLGVAGVASGGRLVHGQERGVWGGFRPSLQPVNTGKEGKLASGK